MPRVKRAVIHLKKRRTLMKAAKGYRWGRKNIIRLARPAVLKAGAYAYRDRRNKKRDFRALWQIKINAAAREHGLTYSGFMAKLKNAKIGLDRKILAQLAEHHPQVFAKIVEAVNAKPQIPSEIPSPLSAPGGSALGGVGEEIER